MICYTCGESVNPKDDSAVMCATCSIHYCSNCSGQDSPCSECGGQLVQTGDFKIGYFNPSDIFVEIMEKEKRQQPRTRVEIRCAYTIQSALRTDMKNREHKALTRDVSKSGICIYSTTPLQSGQRVSFKECGSLPDRSVAEVQWVRKVKGFLYLAGLRFI